MLLWPQLLGELYAQLCLLSPVCNLAALLMVPCGFWWFESTMMAMIELAVFASWSDIRSRPCGGLC